MKNETISVQAENIVKAAIEKEEACTSYQKAHKGKNSGDSGNTTELRVKLAFNLKRAVIQGVSEQGKPDLYKYGIDPTTGKKRRYTIEVKTGGGTIGNILEDGTIVYKWDKYDFICYFPRKVRTDIPVEKQCYFFTGLEFKRCMDSIKGMYKVVKRNGIPKEVKIQNPTQKPRWVELVEFEGLFWNDFAGIYGIKY